MLDNHNRITMIPQALQYDQKLLNIMEMQAGCRLIQDIKSFTGIPFGKLFG